MNWEPRSSLQTNNILDYVASRGLPINCARGFCVFQLTLEFDPQRMMFMVGCVPE